MLIFTLIWKYIEVRHVLAIMAFLGFVNVYGLRVNLSVALVAMIKSQPPVNVTKMNHSDNCYTVPLQQETSNKTSNFEQGEFEWSSKTKGVILSAFFYGYIISQVPGGWLAERYGGKKVFGLGLLWTSLFTLITPPVARLGSGALITLRLLEGLGEGVTYPAMHSLWSKWAPPLERSKLASFSYAGSHLGTVIALPISGALSKYGFAGGWPSVFYVFGMLGTIWCIFWFLLVADTPAEHSRISSEEREYIENSIGKSITHLSKDPVPWFKIATSLPVWAMIVAHVGNNWGFYTLLTNLPTFMKDVLGFGISENGLLSSLPYLCCWLISVLAGVIVDYARKRGVKTIVTRKLCTFLGLVGPAIALVGVSFSGCDYIGAIVAFCIGMGLEGLVFSGFLINHLDIAPKFAGTLFGITNTLATIPGIVTPLFVGALTKDGSTRSQWQKIFWIAAAIYAVAGLFYVIFASGSLQPWADVSVTTENKPKTEEKEEIKESKEMEVRL